MSFARLGRYQLVSRLAVGGMAEVYLARHGELAGFRTLVVVKKVLPNFDGRKLDDETKYTVRRFVAGGVTTKRRRFRRPVFSPAAL